MFRNLTTEDHRELVKLEANVGDAIRDHMSGFGAVESFYNKISGGTGACGPDRAAP